MRINADTLTILWHGTCERMYFAVDDDIDFVSSSDTIMYDNLLSCDSMEFDFDAGRDLWLPASRFTRLKRDYLDPDELDTFLDRAVKIARKDNNRGVITQMHPAIHSRAVGRYQWGNCIVGFTFRGGGRYQPVLSMHSRTSYIAYMGGMDLALCYVLAREIAGLIGLEPEDFAFRWHVGSLLFHDFKSVPYMLNRERMVDAVHDARFNCHPTIRKIRKTFAWIERQEANGIAWHEEKFGPRKRIRRRYTQWMNDESAPSVPIESLTLTL